MNPTETKTGLAMLREWMSPVQQKAAGATIPPPGLTTETGIDPETRVEPTVVKDGVVNPENETGGKNSGKVEKKKPVVDANPAGTDADADAGTGITVTEVNKAASGPVLAETQKRASALLANVPKTVEDLKQFEAYLGDLEKQATELEQRRAEAPVAAAPAAGQPSADAQAARINDRYVAAAVLDTAQKFASGASQAAALEEAGYRNAQHIQEQIALGAQQNPGLAAVIEAAGGLGAFTAKLASEHPEAFLPPEALDQVLAAQGGAAGDPAAVPAGAGGADITPEEEAMVTQQLAAQVADKGIPPEKVQQIVKEIADGLRDGRITPEGVEEAISSDLQAQQAQGEFTPEEIQAAQQLQAAGIDEAKAAQLLEALEAAAQDGVPVEEGVNAMQQELTDPAAGQKAAAGEDEKHQGLRIAFRTILGERAK